MRSSETRLAANEVPFTTPKLILLPNEGSCGAPKLFCLPAGGDHHGLRLCITLARCFREIGVLQPPVCAVSRDKGAKSGPLRGSGPREQSVKRKIPGRLDANPRPQNCQASAPILSSAPAAGEPPKCGNISRIFFRAAGRTKPTFGEGCCVFPERLTEPTQSRCERSVSPATPMATVSPGAGLWARRSPRSKTRQRGFSDRPA